MKKKYKLEYADGWYITGGEEDINFEREVEKDFPQLVCDALNAYKDVPTLRTTLAEREKRIEILTNFADEMAGVLDVVEPNCEVLERYDKWAGISTNESE